MGKKTLTLVLFWILVLHLILSVAFIINPSFLRGRLSVFYRVYVMPGPFFTDSQIIDTYSVNLSWKENDAWSLQINPSLESFRKIRTSFNPTELYRSRIVQAFYPRQTETFAKVKKPKFDHLKHFLFDRYVPEQADSVRIWFINKKAVNFAVKTDSVLVIIPR